MEHDGDSQSPPFRSQLPSALLPRRLSPVALILAILILTLLILFFLLPPFLSHANQLLRPNSVKKSWDTLNILLVLFAILIGLFATWNDKALPADDAVAADDHQSHGGNRLKFFDYSEPNFHARVENLELRRSHEAEREGRETVVREIPGDEFEVSTSAPPPPKSPTPPPPPPPPPKATLKPRRSLHKQMEMVDTCKLDDEAEISTNPPAAEEISAKVHRKKSGTTREIATTITSFYKGQKKRKKREISTPSVVEPQQSTPLPPSEVSQNFFKKSSTVPTTAPPPPPPPSSILNSFFKSRSKSWRFKKVTTSPPPPPAEPRRAHTGKRPKPTKPTTQYENVIIAPPSPLIPLPPPPPPFRMPEISFVARGDFVRIRSTHSSGCSSPELEDIDVMSVKSDGGDSVGPSISCPIPDVNVKADIFITKFYDELRQEQEKTKKRRLG